MISTDDNTDDTTLEIDEDGVITTYTIDAEGNAVNDKGEVIYNKEQLEELGDEVTDSPIDLSAVVDTTKIPIFDEEGNQGYI